MKDKNQTTESFDQWDDWAQRTYRTGGTQPPKTHGGLIAFLLVMVIFLCGISTALGLMNIRLFRQLNAQSVEETVPVVFSQAAEMASDQLSSPLGFEGQPVSGFWQNYRDLPKGIYITEVLSGSDACAKGIHPGDILIRLNGTEVADTQTLQELLNQYSAGSCVTVCLYREGQELEFSITLQ